MSATRCRWSLSCSQGINPHSQLPGRFLTQSKRRFGKPTYTDRERRPWAKFLRHAARKGVDAFVYFNNDVNTRAPSNALRLIELVGSFAVRSATPSILAVNAPSPTSSLTAVILAAGHLPESSPNYSDLNARKHRSKSRQNSSNASWGPLGR
jgi:hypothetical protein